MRTIASELAYLDGLLQDVVETAAPLMFARRRTLLDLVNAETTWADGETSKMIAKAGDLPNLTGSRVARCILADIGCAFLPSSERITLSWVGECIWPFVKVARMTDEDAAACFKYNADRMVAP